MIQYDSVALHPKYFWKLGRVLIFLSRKFDDFSFLSQHHFIDLANQVLCLIKINKG